MNTTRLSSKGQIIIPQHIREAHRWQPGLEFVVIDTDQGLLLTPRMPYKPTTIDEVSGCVNYKGPRKSLKQMKEGIAKGAKKQK